MKKTLIAETLRAGLISTLVVFVILELICRVAEVVPVGSSFVENVVYESKLTFRKPENEFRIFAYGESTFHGAQYGPTSSPIRWMEEYLKDFLPEKKIKVVNFSRLGSSVNFANHALEETLSYHPDLILFYLGHNAFMPGNRFDQVLERQKKFSYHVKHFFLESRLVSFVYRKIIRFRMIKDKTLGPQDSMEYSKIETPPDPKLGPDNKTPSTQPYYWKNLEFYEHNLAKILQKIKDSKVPAIFLKPVGNLKDFSPNASGHLKTLSPEELKAWQELYDQGRQALSNKQMASALSFFEKAYTIDPTYADLNYQMGTIYLSQGELTKAKLSFEEARDHDIIICRANQDLLNLLEKQLIHYKIPYMDTEKILVSQAPGGILGEPVVEDNVHFSISGQAAVGRAIANEIAKYDWMAPSAEWHFDRERSFQDISKEMGINDELIFSAYLKTIFYFANRLDNRLRFAQMALKMKPDNMKALRHTAWAYWLKGDDENAKSYYEKIKIISPKDFDEIAKDHPEIPQKLFPATSSQEPSKTVASTLRV